MVSLSLMIYLMISASNTARFDLKFWDRELIIVVQYVITVKFQTIYNLPIGIQYLLLVLFL